MTHRNFYLARVAKRKSVRGCHLDIFISIAYRPGRRGALQKRELQFTRVLRARPKKTAILLHINGSTFFCAKDTRNDNTVGSGERNSLDGNQLCLFRFINFSLLNFGICITVLLRIKFSLALFCFDEFRQFRGFEKKRLILTVRSNPKRKSGR